MTEKQNQSNDLSTMPEYETLKNLVVNAHEDMEKALGGTKAAGMRIRKVMQEVKKTAQIIRQKILENQKKVGKVKAPWASYMEIHPMEAGKIWVRWTGVDGIYRWLHPVSLTWVEEPNQIEMPTFADYASARIAADDSPEPPTWSEFHKE